MDSHTYVFMRFFPSVHAGDEAGITDRVIRREINLQCLAKMKKYISKWEIDIIHTNSLTHLVGAELSRQAYKAHVWHIRETLKNHYGFEYDNRLSYKYVLKKTEKVICISNYVKETYKKILHSVSTSVLKDGFCIDQYILNGVYSKQKTEYHMLICGFINEGKGQLEALKAIDCLINKCNIRNIYLKIVVDGTSDYRKKLDIYIKKKLHEFVEILPFQRGLSEIRKNTDIALMCSKKGQSIINMNEYAYSLNTLSKENAMRKILAYTKGWYVYGIGRWGLHKHLNSDVVVETVIKFIDELVSMS